MGETTPKASNSKQISLKKFLDMEDSEVDVEEGRSYERDIENVFGRKIALGLIAVNFKYKEVAMKVILKHAERHLAPAQSTRGNN